jgi:hypothetical protein
MVPELQRLIDSGELQVGEELFHRRRQHDEQEISARVVPQGIEVGGLVYPSPSTAARAAGGKPTNGWLYWRLRRSAQPIDGLRRGTVDQP